MPEGIAGGTDIKPPAGTSEYWTDITYIYYYVRLKNAKKKKLKFFIFWCKSYSFYYYYILFGVNAAPCVDVDDNIDNLGPTLPDASSVPVLVLGLPALGFFLMILSSIVIFY